MLSNSSRKITEPKGRADLKSDTAVRSGDYYAIERRERITELLRVGRPRDGRQCVDRWPVKKRERKAQRRRARRMVTEKSDAWAAEPIPRFLQAPIDVDVDAEGKEILVLDEGNRMVATMNVGRLVGI
ncbi:hypothetical protein B0H13DRAFT_1873429 [Mycena leptocephala]|nr:hypothetical protein B0H13DRAFT_1873429 [Mycena leptocephala]